MPPSLKQQLIGDAILTNKKIDRVFFRDEQDDTPAYVKDMYKNFLEKLSAAGLRDRGYTEVYSKLARYPVNVILKNIGVPLKPIIKREDFPHYMDIASKIARTATGFFELEEFDEGTEQYTKFRKVIKGHRGLKKDEQKQIMKKIFSSQDGKSYYDNLVSDKIIKKGKFW